VEVDVLDRESVGFRGLEPRLEEELEENPVSRLSRLDEERLALFPSHRPDRRIALALRELADAAPASARDGGVRGDQAIVDGFREHHGERGMSRAVSGA